MLIDGNQIASDLLLEVKNKVSKLATSPKLTAITCAPNFETQKYLEMKKAHASSVGIILNVVELPQEATTDDVLACIDKVIGDSDGIVAQLPLPEHIDREIILSAIPANKDPDGFRFGYEEKACLSPVVGAIDEISKKYKISWEDKKVVILGEGRLVGMPSFHYAKLRGARVDIFNQDNFDSSKLLEADIVVSGIGQPGFIKEAHVKDGVVIFDAGTSEDGGVLVGDVSEKVAKKTKLMTPVPGGIGPITIAYLLSNLVSLVRQ